MAGSRVRSALGSAVFLLVAPGVVAGLIPWLLTGWQRGEVRPPLQLLGALLIAVGVIVLLEAFARFVVEGIGTPAPVAPTHRLVVGGAEYEEYNRAVPGWWPRLRPWRG